MYNPLPILLYGFSGIAGLLLFSYGESATTFYIAATFFGIYSGSFFFYFVFHSLVHPEKSSRYVSINETIVGATTIIGTLLAGYLATTISKTSPYTVMAIFVIIVIIIQSSLHSTKFSIKSYRN